MLDDDDTHQRPASPISGVQEHNPHRAATSAAPRRSPRSYQGVSCARFRRFRPDCVYVRRNFRRQRSTASTSTPTQQNAATTFISKVTRKMDAPLLQEPPRPQKAGRRGRRHTLAPTRKSVRIAAATWPRGDTHQKARQVLMKKLGFMEEEGQSTDDALLEYFKMFGGPLSGQVIQALTALCGLEEEAGAGCS